MDPRIRKDSAPKPVLFPVVLPHADEVLGAHDQRLEILVILEDSRQRRRHQGLSKPDHIADKDPTTLVDVVGGNLDSGNLKLEKLIAEILRDAELEQAFPRILAEVVGHLDVDVVRRDRFLDAPNSPQGS